MKASVIVLTWNGEKFIMPCLTALLSQEYAPFEVIVVDNASVDASVAIAQSFAPRMRVIRNDYNLGFAAGNNVGLQVADGDIVVLLNQDTVVQSGWLRAIIDTLADSTVGIVGCKALYPDGCSFQHAGGIVDPACAFTRHIGWDEPDQGQYDAPSEPDFVTGAALAIHRRVLQKLGGLDEQFHPAFFEEVDYCYRARRAGFRVVYQPRAVLYHHETASLPNDLQRGLTYHRNRIRFLLRHWSTQQFQSFANAESPGIQNDLLPDDLVARARAYWENLLALPALAYERQNDVTLGGTLTSGELRWLIEALQSLRQQAHARLLTLTSEQVPSTEIERGAEPSTNLVAQGEDDVQSFIRELQNRAILQEPRLRSNVPVLGRLIGGFRSFWISLVGRHYVVPILNQQSAFNAKMAESLRLQADAHAYQVAMLYQEIARLRQEMAQQHQTQADLRQGIATLKQQIDATERIQRILRADEAAIPQALQMLAESLQGSKERLG